MKKKTKKLYKKPEHGLTVDQWIRLATPEIKRLRNKINELVDRVNELGTQEK